MNIYPTLEQEEEDIKLIYKNCLGYEDNQGIMDEIIRDERELNRIELEAYEQDMLKEQNERKINKKIKKTINKNDRKI